MVVFGFLWIRELSRAKRIAVASPSEERAPARAAMPEPASGERFPRSRFLEGATLGLGALIGGVVTVPPVGLLVAASLEGQKFHDIDLGPLSDYPSGKFIITTFVE